MKKLLNPLVLMLMIISMISSCSKSDNEGITAIPYQETEKGQWGMISTDGEIIFSDEFKNEPTVVKEDMFMVKNNEGLWEIYKIDKKPKKVGSEYVSATLFNNGKALVCERNKHITIIDKDGNTLKTLDKIDGKEVRNITAFKNGYAVYQTGDFYGVIDEDAKPVIPAEYCKISECSDGKFIAIDKKYQKELSSDSLEQIKYTILDEKGKKLFELNGAKYCKVGEFMSGLLPVCVKKDGNEMWGLIDEKQTVIVKPTEKLKGIGEVYDDMFTYYNGDGWGLMTLKGETLIRAKYDFLSFDCDGKLMAYTNEKSGKSSMKFIDKDDNQIGKDSYLIACPFYSLDGSHSLVKVNDKQWSIINDKGEQLEKLPDMINVSVNTGDYYVESDYVDFTKLFDDLKISQDGMEGVTFASSPKTVAEKLSQFRMTGDKKHPGASAYWYDYVSDFNYYRTANNVPASINISFSGRMSRQTYRTQRVIDYVWEDWYWYHDNKIPTGYAWNNVNIKSFTLEFSNDGIMRGKLRLTLQELAKRLKKTGKVVKENDGAVVLTLNNGKTAFIYMESKRVVLIWGNIGSANSIIINKYADVKEDMGSYDQVPERYDSDDADIAEVDSTAEAPID